RVERFIGQAVWMLGRGLQLHQVDDVDHPHLELRQMLAQQRNGRERLRVVRRNRSWDKPFGCSDAGCSFIRSTTLTTRTLSSGRCLRSSETAASVSSVGNSPPHAIAQ